MVVVGELMAVDAGSDSWAWAPCWFGSNVRLQSGPTAYAGARRQTTRNRFYQNTIVFLMLLVGVPFAVSWPATALQWGALHGSGIRRGSLMLMSVAYRQAEAQRLVAIEYSIYLGRVLGWWFSLSPSPHGRFWGRDSSYWVLGQRSRRRALADRVLGARCSITGGLLGLNEVSVR